MNVHSMIHTMYNKHELRRSHWVLLMGHSSINASQNIDNGPMIVKHYTELKCYHRAKTSQCLNIKWKSYHRNRLAAKNGSSF